MHVMNQLLTDSSKNILPLHQKVRDRYYDSRSTGNISGLSMQKQDEISKQIKIQAQIEAQKFYTLDNILSFRNEESIQFLKSYFFASNIMPLFNFRIEHETGNFELKKTKKDTSGFFLEGNTSYNQFNCWHDNVGDDLMPILPYTATNFLGQSDEPYLYRVSRYSPSLNRHYLESFLTNIIYQMENDSKIDWVNPNRCDFISNFNDTNNLGKLFNSLEFFKKFKNNYFNLFSETDKDLYYIKPYLQDNYMKLNITVSFTDEELSHINSFRLKQIEQ